jgi:hypothetical protein
MSSQAEEPLVAELPRVTTTPEIAALAPRRRYVGFANGRVEFPIRWRRPARSSCGEFSAAGRLEGDSVVRQLGGSPAAQRCAG